ncbi:MAG: hypothetical protein ACQETF_11220 [Bacteroidota bacterium]
MTRKIIQAPYVPYKIRQLIGEKSAEFLNMLINPKRIIKGISALLVARRTIVVFMDATTWRSSSCVDSYIVRSNRSPARTGQVYTPVCKEE